MPVLTEVQFTHEDGALAHTLEALPSTDVSVVRETSTAPGESVYYLRFDGARTAAIEAALRRDDSVAEAESMPNFEDRLWAIEFADETRLLAPQVTKEGGLVVDARTAHRPGESHVWHERWLLPDREAIHRVWKYARDADFEFTLLKFHHGGQLDAKYRGLDALTEEQRRTIAVAHEQGYFAEPRETSLEELGESLDLSASAVGGRLKRGMKALIGGTLVVDRPGE